MQWRWPLQREKTEEADGGISGKKGSDLPVFLSGSILAFHSDLGRRSFGKASGVQNKQKHG